MKRTINLLKKTGKIYKIVLKTFPMYKLKLVLYI